MGVLRTANASGAPVRWAQKYPAQWRSAQRPSGARAASSQHKLCAFGAPASVGRLLFPAGYFQYSAELDHKLRSSMALRPLFFRHERGLRPVGETPAFTDLYTLSFPALGLQFRRRVRIADVHRIVGLLGGFESPDSRVPVPISLREHRVDNPLLALPLCDPRLYLSS